MAETTQSENAAQQGEKPVPTWPLGADPTPVDTLIRSFGQMLESTLRRLLAEVAVRPVSSSEPEINPPKKTGLDLRSIEKLKAADLRVALLIGKTPEVPSLLIDIKTLATLLSVSKAMLWRLLAVQAIPAPIRMGKLNRWRLAEIIEWIEAGCPPQEMWSAKKSVASKKKGN